MPGSNYLRVAGRWLPSPFVPVAIGLALRFCGYPIMTRVLVCIGVAWWGVTFVLWLRRRRTGANRNPPTLWRVAFNCSMSLICWCLATNFLWQQLVPHVTPMEVEAQESGLDFETVAASFDASFLSVRPDGGGRVFVGGRESLFVIERDTNGGYRAPQELFRFPPNSWLNDVAIRGDDLYVMTNAALYLLPKARVKRSGLECRRLIWGIPLDMHAAFHSFAWGPEGDLYFSAGDPYLSAGALRDVPDHWGFWTLYGPQGETLLKHVGAGGVFRCRPDGTRLQQVAGGLRAPFGLAFDSQWNLYVCDNDHESRPNRFSPARILKIAQGVDFGWPRGWTQSNTPRRSDLPSTVTESLGPGVPIGLTFHDGCTITRGSAALLVSRWEGGVDCALLGGERGTTGSVHRWLKTNVPTRPLCIAADVDGAVWLSLCKMKANASSPHYPSEIRRYAAPSTGVAASFDVVQAKIGELVSALDAPAFALRSIAHQELIRRGAGDSAVPVSTELFDRWNQAPTDSTTRLHLPWILAAGRSLQAADVVTECCRDPQSDVRLQGLRIAETFIDLPIDPKSIRAAVNDESISVRAAAIAAGLSRNLWSVDDFVEIAGESPSLDVLRQIGRGMADRLNPEQLAVAASHASSLVRLAATLAAGQKLITPSVDEARRLAQPCTAPNCFHEITFVGETVDIRTLETVGVFATSDLWRDAASDPRRRCFELLRERLDDPDDRVRFQAAYYLELLDDHSARPLVHRTWLNADAKLLDPRPSEPVSDAVVDAIDGRSRLRFRRISPSRQPVEFTIDPPLAADVTVNDEAAADKDGRWYSYFEPGTNDVVVRLHAAATTAEVGIALRTLNSAAVGRLPPPGPVADAAIARAPLPPDEAATIDWLDGLSDPQLKHEVAAASAEVGRRIVGRDGVGCVRCHSIIEGGRGGGAPSLFHVQHRLALRHLAESIVAPSKAVAPQYRRSTIALDDGRIVRGLVLSDERTSLIMLTEDGRRIALEKSRIEERAVDEVSAMPTGLIPTRSGVLNALNYLIDHSPTPP